MKQYVTMLCCVLSLSILSCKQDLTAWKDALAERDKIIIELREQNAALRAERDKLAQACAPAPTRAAAPTPLPEPPAEPAQAGQLEQDRAAAADVDTALARLVAATTGGVTYDRYQQLTEDLNFALQQMRSPIAHAAYRTAMNESIKCFQQAGKLWTGCLQKYEPCRDITGWAIQTYNMPFKDKSVSIFTSEIYMNDTLSYLWGVGAQKLENARSLQQ